MINSSLQAFASNVQKAGRISFGDVKRLQRDILPDGISSRAEAELLLTLDQTVSRADRAFADWLVAMMVDFVVWGLRPTGTMDAETAAWLTPFLLGQRTTKTLRRLARELVAEADHYGIALPSPALNGASEDCASAWVSSERAGVAGRLRLRGMHPALAGKSPALALTARRTLHHE